MNRKIFLTMIMILGAGAIACQPEDPTDDTVDHVENAGEEVQDAGQDVANKVEDECEEVKEEAGAEDPDC
jgi:hypothetical protein